MFLLCEVVINNSSLTLGHYPLGAHVHVLHESALAQLDVFAYSKMFHRWCIYKAVNIDFCSYTELSSPSIV